MHRAVMPWAGKLKLHVVSHSPLMCINGHRLPLGKPDKMLLVNLWWTSIPSKGSSNASNYKKRVELWPCGSPLARVYLIYEHENLKNTGAINRSSKQEYLSVLISTGLLFKNWPIEGFLVFRIPYCFTFCNGVCFFKIVRERQQQRHRCMISNTEVEIVH